jgi:hypothetical protein
LVDWVGGWSEVGIAVEDRGVRFCFMSGGWVKVGALNDSSCPILLSHHPPND